MLCWIVGDAIKTLESRPLLEMVRGSVELLAREEEKQNFANGDWKIDPLLYAQNFYFYFFGF